MPKRRHRIDYRTARFGVKFTLQIGEDMRDAIRAGAEKALMRPSDFARMLLSEGLKNWWALRAPKPRRSGGG
jgi:hypothetical protein